MMKIDMKAKWLEALRSGDYKQGRNALKQDGCFCCLGVLCDIIDPNGWNEYGHFDGDRNYLSSGVKETVGMTPWEVSQVADMNDCERKSFTEIADWIEKNL